MGRTSFSASCAPVLVTSCKESRATQLPSSHRHALLASGDLGYDIAFLGAGSARHKETD